MKHRELSPEEAVDRVLMGLREVEPSQGMQQRVLRGARERANSRRKSSGQIFLSGRYSWMVATAGIAAVALAVFWTIARSHRMAQVAILSPGYSESVTAPIKAPINAPIRRTRLAAAHIGKPRLAVKPRRIAIEAHTATVEAASDQDSLALSEMNAPSTPAPPMPLTEQEKLLAQILHKGDPVELAMLDPKVRNSEQTGDKADFERFFKQSPKIIEIKLPLNNKHLTGDEK